MKVETKEKEAKRIVAFIKEKKKDMIVLIILRVTKTMEEMIKRVIRVMNTE